MGLVIAVLFIIFIIGVFIFGIEKAFQFVLATVVSIMISLASVVIVYVLFTLCHKYLGPYIF